MKLISCNQEMKDTEKLLRAPQGLAWYRYSIQNLKLCFLSHQDDALNFIYQYKCKG